MPYALITGASGGIGWALAKELASRKHDVLLLARSEQTLKKNCQELQNKFDVRADYFVIDLSIPDSALRARDWLTGKNYLIDILINNAGYGLWGPLNEVNIDELKSMMYLNMQTLVDFSKLILPDLRKSKRAYILNVASTAAYQAVPTMSTYAATKVFVLFFSRGLRWELKGTNVSVSCVSPGPTSTGFINRAHLEVIKERAEKVSMTPEAVAKIAINGMFAGKAEIIPGALNWISVKFAELLPKSLTERIAMNLYKTNT